MSEVLSRPVDQLGFVVPDPEQAIQVWLEKGIGPWFTIGEVMLSHYEHLGRKSGPRVDAASTQVGSVQLELIHQVDDEPPIEFLEAGGDRLHPVGWFADDLERDHADAEAAGHELLQTGSVLGTPCAYFALTPPGSTDGLIAPDSVSGGKEAAVIETAALWNGEIAELLAPNKMSRDTFAKVGEAAATWDGTTDPVRHVLARVLERGFELQTLAQRVGRWFRERS